MAGFQAGTRRWWQTPGSRLKPFLQCDHTHRTLWRKAPLPGGAATAARIREANPRSVPSYAQNGSLPGRTSIPSRELSASIASSSRLSAIQPAWPSPPVFQVQIE